MRCLGGLGLAPTGQDSLRSALINRRSTGEGGFVSRPDQSITFLRSFGYSVFRFPRASAQPLELMHRDGKELTRLGMLTQLVGAGAVPLPTIRRDDRPGIDIEGRETSKINVGIGLSFLSSFIGALGGSNLGLQAGFNRARTMTFQYSGVMEDSVDVLAVETFIKAGTISPYIPPGTLEKLLDDEIYVVTSVLKTNKIVVDAQGDAGQAVQLDVPVIQQAVGGNVKVDRQGSLGSKVSFEGGLPLAFGLQAAQVVFDDSGQFLTTQQLPAGDAAARAAFQPAVTPSTKGPVFLEARGAFVRVGM
jgi:hypothetical protein